MYMLMVRVFSGTIVGEMGHNRKGIKPSSNGGQRATLRQQARYIVDR
jgi:hypothetical protein